MKKLIITFFLFFMISPIGDLFAQDGSLNDHFANGNRKYEEGKFDEALGIYKNLLQQGLGGTPLYYNLGNLFYRRGERGKAILWYERALRNSPRDSDIKFNLSLARAHIKDSKGNIFDRLAFLFTGNELAISSSIFIWIFFILLGAISLGWVRGETWPNLTLWTSGMLLILSVSWLGFHVAWEKKALAIVTEIPGEVRNGPGTDYAVGFTVPEGSKLLVLNERPEWTQVGILNAGLKGWMPSSELERINITSSLLN